MNKKSKRHFVKSIWGFIGVASVILGLIASILQISGAIDFWSLLILPTYTFLVTNIPFYYAVLFIILCLSIYSIIRYLRKPKSCILDLEDGRKIAILCQTPRTTEFLRQQYDYWESQSSVVFLGGYGFDDYMKRLEKQGFLEYINGKWQVTTKALEYIAKYHGG